MKKVITMNSGGLDSLIAIKRLYDLGYEQHSVYIDVGQPNRERAKESAKRIAEKYCKSHEVLVLSSDSRDTFATSNQIKSRVNVKERVPFTGFIFPIMVAMVGMCDDVEYVSLGGLKPVTKGESQAVLQNRMSYFLKNEPLGGGVKILQPLDIVNTDEELFELAKVHKLTKEEMSLTVSCNRKNPCKECIKCKMRREFGISLN